MKPVTIRAAVTLSILLGVPASPGLFAGGETPLSMVRQLTYEGRRSGEAYFSPAGDALVFQSEREPGNPFYQIYTMSLRDGSTRRISPGIGKTTCAFFRPGRGEVLFASTHLDPDAVKKQEAETAFRASGKERRYSWDYDEHMDIFSAKLDGSELTRLTDAPGYDAEGAYSPDGGQIVFCSMRDAFPLAELPEDKRNHYEIDPSYFGEIYIMNADGSNPRRLTDRPGYDGGPFFSPDGERIVWRAFDEKGMIADIFTMRTDGTDKRQITDFESMSWAPYYHPSGRYIIFASNKHGFANFELFLVDTEGTREPVRVTDREGFDGLPVFSPDGAMLAWTSNATQGETSQIFLGSWNHEAALAALEAAPVRPNPPADPVVASAAEPAEDETVAPADADITADELRRRVEFLASDAMEGRMTGSDGARRAAEYLAEQMRAMGAEPMGGSYFHPFEYTSGVEPVPDANALAVTLPSGGGSETLEYGLDDGQFLPLAFSSNGEIEGELVFAGYGLSVPGGMEDGYDSYAGLDVEGKIVLALRYVPEGADVERRRELNRYAGLRYKATIARERGAKGLLVFTGPTSPNAGELAALRHGNTLGDSGLPAASISGELAERIFEAAGKNLREVQEQLDLENPHFEGSFELPGVGVQLKTGLERIRSKDRNVIGALRPAGAEPEEWILIGAHYDHIGYGETGSLADKEHQGEIHNGADDNASGTAAVLEIGGALAAQMNAGGADIRRGVILAFWSGEELGLIGSSRFADDPPVPLEHIAAYLNFDMVGRLRENRLTVQGAGSSSVWTQILESKNIMAGFQLNIQPDPYLPTDTTAFYPKGIPVLNFFTGGHEDYNKPSDDPDTLNYEGMERVAQLGLGVAEALLAMEERPDYLKVESAKSGGGGRETMRVYLGTIPDYTHETEGLMLSGVSGGGPADKAGLRGGDVIVELAGQEIKNIYDYTYAIDALKIGEPATVTVLRDGGRVTLEIVPEPRR